MAFSHQIRYKQYVVVHIIVLLLIQLGAIDAILTNKPALPKNYQSLSASAKEEVLWNIIKSKEGTQSRFPSLPLQIKFVLSENITPTVTHYGDDVPYNHAKRVHSVGAVVTTQFVITNTDSNPYTGIFQTGAQYGLSRLSIPESPRGNRFTPGIAVKLLRANSKSSANFFAMISVEGQKGGNFFRPELSNHIPQLSDDASINLKLVERKFRQASNYPFQVGLSDISKFYENGTAVDPAVQSNFPFQLILVPNPTLSTLFSTFNTEEQLKEGFITKISSNTTLYTIYGIVSPTNNTRILIGELITKTKPIYSKWGDEFLFFQHQKMEDDFKIRPEWEPKSRRSRRRQLSEISNNNYNTTKYLRTSSHKFQHLLDDIAHNTHLASIHANVSLTTADRVVSSCAFAHLV